MGEWPRHLLCQCDEWLLVMRAEPVAFRTLPLFFETVKAVQQEDSGATLRGILLTQPAPGKWETDLRRYLGSRVLPQTIPEDPEVDQAAAKGHAVTAHNAQSPAAVQYLDLVSSLALREATPARPARASRKTPAAGGVATLAPPRKPALRKAVEAVKSRLSPAAHKADPAAPDSPAPGKRPSSRSGVKRKAARRAKSQSKLPVRPWQVWIGAGVLGGTFLGAVKSPELVVPCAVGLVTTAGVALAVKLIGNSNQQRGKGADADR
jgi:hypothetical protein